VTLVAAFALTLANPPAARAQACQHGTSIFKTCESPKKRCATNADCNDSMECTDDVCDPSLGNTTDCVITLTTSSGASPSTC
jgi:hypothetical protein